MDEKDFARIEVLFTKLSAEFGQKVDGLSAEFSQKVDGLSADFSNKLNAQSEDFHRWLGVQGDQFQHKLDIAVDGVQMLAEKVDRLDVRMEGLERKLEVVAIGLTAHRTDTEAHHGMYRVKES